MSEGNMKFEKVLDKMPAISFAREFSREFEKEAFRQLGPVIPNDRRKLFQIAEQVLILMGSP